MKTREIIERIRTICLTILLLTVTINIPEVNAQESQQKRNGENLSGSLDRLGKDLSEKLNLSESQQGRIRTILREFQEKITLTGNTDEKGKVKNEPVPPDKTNKTRQDRTDVKNNDDIDLSTGTAKTKNQTNENMTNSSSHIAVNFERARIDADSRIEEMLTPEQAIQYGKIKSDWWDKVRENTNPGIIRNTEEGK
ncbi:MAG: hypothetical protein ACM34K_19840 [Bacillota bacterium]